MSTELPWSRPMRSKHILLAAGLALVVAVVLAGPLEAQQVGGLGSQSLRPYRFVFLAYAIAWVLVFGWVVAVARRLARLEARLRD